MKDPAQSSPVPAQGQNPAWSDLSWLIRYSVRGLFELVRARLIFSRLRASDIPARNRNSRKRAEGERPIANADAGPVQVSLARISYVIPRLSDRLPWRSDCLIQAIAAQNWLLSLSLDSEIQIGVEMPQDGDFGAHAWLLHKGIVITGGDIDQYEPILTESRFDKKADPEK